MLRGKKMAQDDVIKFLKKNKGKLFGVKEIADRLKITPGSVASNCRRLEKHDEVEKKSVSVNPGGRKYVWGYLE